MSVLLPTILKLRAATLEKLQETQDEKLFMILQLLDVIEESTLGESESLDKRVTTLIDKLGEATSASKRKPGRLAKMVSNTDTKELEKKVSKLNKSVLNLYTRMRLLELRASVDETPRHSSIQ